jgi:hypothetical protein
MVRMVLQDQRANCRASRTCVIPPEASHAIEETVVDQAINAATDPAFQASYQAALRPIHRRPASGSRQRPTACRACNFRLRCTGNPDGQRTLATLRLAPRALLRHVRSRPEPRREGRLVLRVLSQSRGRLRAT